MHAPPQLRFADEVDRDGAIVRSFLARIPEARALHAARGLTDEESWDTLRELPRHARLDRLLHGSPGLRKAWWVELAFSGRLVQLGRLQFEPRAGRLAVHVPEEGGPLSPAAVDASLARAREVFPDVPQACCTSWLLDPQLADHLRPGSNILRFQRRFAPTGERSLDDAHVLEFVFHTLDPDLDRLPRDTTLQRAIVDRLRRGGHWFSVAGTLAL